MLKTMFVHIGPPKTGTTSIQRTFFNNAALLEEHGLFYYTGRWSHHPISRQMHRQTQMPNYQRASEDFFQAAAASRCEAGLFSSEMLVVLTQREINEAKRKFLEVAESVKVIAYVRHPVSFAVSLAHQAVRGGKPIDLIEESPNMRNVPKLLSRWAKAVGQDNMIVRPFDRDQLVAGDAVDDMLNVLGLDGLRARVERVRANEGLSVLALALLDELNRQGDGHPLRKPYLRAVNRLGGPRYVLPQETIDKVRATTAADVVHLRRHWQIDLPEPTPTPSKPLGLDADEVRSLSEMVLSLVGSLEEERAARLALERDVHVWRHPLRALRWLVPGRRKARKKAEKPDADDEETGEW